MVLQGTWSGPGVSSNQFDPSGQNGTVTLSFTPSSGCANSNDLDVIVNPAPVANPATFTICVISVAPPVAEYDLPALENQINGGTGFTVNYYTDVDATTPIDDINDVINLPTTIFATVFDGTCESTSATITVETNFAPVANPASQQACDEGGNMATFNLTELENTIGSGLPVTFYTDPGGNNPIGTPSSYVSGTTTVYAIVSGTNGCDSEAAEVQLTVTGASIAFTATLEACESISVSNEATFNLTTIESIVNGGTGLTVNWYYDFTTTNPITPAVLFTPSTTVYATVTSGSCTSDPVGVALTVLPAPASNPSSITLCDIGSNLALFDLTTVEAVVSDFTGNSVEWFFDINGGFPITTPASLISGSNTVYAFVSDGTCSSQATPVDLIVQAAPAINSAGPMEQCGDVNGEAVFDLTSLDATINNNTGLPVIWTFDSGGSNQIPKCKQF